MIPRLRRSCVAKRLHDSGIMGTSNFDIEFFMHSSSLNLNSSSPLLFDDAFLPKEYHSYSFPSLVLIYKAISSFTVCLSCINFFTRIHVSYTLIVFYFNSRNDQDKSLVIPTSIFTRNYNAKFIKILSPFQLPSVEVFV